MSDAIAATHAELKAAERRIAELESALRSIASYAPEITHGWAEHVRHIARQALK